MSTKLMTIAQGNDFAKMGREKGVTAVQAEQARRSGTFGLALDAAKAGRRIGYVLDPPPGGRVHMLRAKVILDRDWQEAVNAAGPQTPANYNVQKVGNLYLPTGQGEVEREYILLHNNRAGYDAALQWAKNQELNPTVPREVFAIGEHNPTLHQQLDFNPLWLAATTECQFEGNRQACDVWWNDTERKANLDWVENFDSANDWFAFSRYSFRSPVCRREFTFYGNDQNCKGS